MCVEMTIGHGMNVTKNVVPFPSFAWSFIGLVQISIQAFTCIDMTCGFQCTFMFVLGLGKSVRSFHLVGH